MKMKCKQKPRRSDFCSIEAWCSSTGGDGAPPLQNIDTQHDFMLELSVEKKTVNPAGCAKMRLEIMITLSKELQQAIQEADEQPVRLVNPETNVEYVVLPAEIFNRMQGVFYDTDPLTPEERHQLLVRVGLSVGWDDPAMDVYNDLDPRGDNEGSTR